MNMTLFFILGLLYIIYRIDKKKKSKKKSFNPRRRKKQNTHQYKSGKQKGDDFEKFVVKSIAQNQNFKLTEWRGDKYIDGIYAETNQSPDLQYSYIPTKFKFSIECKYRSKFNSTNSISICKNRDQLKRYKNFAKENRMKVYFVLGIGGSAEAPLSLYLIPLKAINSLKISEYELEPFRKNNTFFRFDPSTYDLY